MSHQQAVMDVMEEDILKTLVTLNMTVKSALHVNMSHWVMKMLHPPPPPQSHLRAVSIERMLFNADWTREDNELNLLPK